MNSRDSTNSRNSPHVARTARAVTRPIISIMFAGVIAGAVLEGIELPERFWVIAGVVILEWWGERAITRIRGKE